MQELTQPQGHSTSGSHERYKSPERLQWEKDNDCIKRMAEWIIENQIATEEEINELRLKAVDFTKMLKIPPGKIFRWSENSCELFKEIYLKIPDTSKTEGISHLENELNSALNPVFLK